MMKNKKKRNKKHRPREIKANAVDWAIAGVHTFPFETQRDLMKPPNEAFTKLREGLAGRDDWNLICQTFNVAEALCMLNIGNNLADCFKSGHNALSQIALRMLAGKSSTCYAQELHDITEALDMHRIQLKLCTQAEYSRALEKVRNLIGGGAQYDVAKIYSEMQHAA